MRDPLIAVWPIKTIPVRHITPVKGRPVTRGPQPIAGRPQTVVSSAGGWRLVYTGCLARKSNILAFRALLALIEGRAEPIYVGPYDYANGPVRRAGATSPIYHTFTNGKIFSSGYRFVSSLSDCTLAAGAAKGATEIVITNSQQAPLQAGDYIELSGRLHVIESLIVDLARIWPPLRAAHAAGTKIEIDDPRMLAYLEEKEAGLQMQFGRWGEIDLSFEEANW
ncbi:MAG: hypothetical protein FJX45_10415 [Alphaproteobacteria bacterium]|nr:hypothetical protein [Alphaproteobacteria bacterium]MBM3654748.1 hypothetical protein [Alphaproteobacteria bacterium]